jgi:hypothetical protein
MGKRARLALGGPSVTILTIALTACSGAGDLAVLNESDDEVWVSTVDEEFEVSATGGTVVLDYGCTPGDVTVEFTSGRLIAVAGPVCSDEQIVIHDDGEVVVEAVVDEK